MTKPIAMTKPIKLVRLGDARRLTHGTVGVATELNGRSMMHVLS